MQEGSCLCGAVSFQVAGKLSPPVACHCSQCRKQSGHFWVSTDIPRTALTLEGADKPCLFGSLPRTERTRRWSRTISVAMGAFDQPTETRLAQHIYVADKGDYYDIADGLPQNQH